MKPSDLQRVFDEEEDLPVEPKTSNPFDFMDPKSKLGSTLSGVVQGGTLGFGDELGGALDAAGEYIHPHHLTSEEAGREEDLAEVAPKDSLEEAFKKYRSTRNDLRKHDAEAAEAHPVLHGAGEVAGSFAVPVPGSAGLKGLQGTARLAKFAKLGAPVGAAYGLGKSEANNARDAILDTGQGAALGAAGSAVLGPIVEEAAGATTNALNRAFARRAVAQPGRSASVEMAARQQALRELDDSGRLLPELQDSPRTKLAQMKSIGRSIPAPDPENLPSPEQVDADQVRQLAQGSQLQKFWAGQREQRLNGGEAVGPFESPDAMRQTQQTAARQTLDQAKAYRDRGSEAANRVIKARQEDPVWSKRADRESEIRKAFGGPSTSVPEERIRSDIERSRETPEYTLEHETTPYGTLRVKAMSPEGVEYGHADFEQKPDSLKPQGTLVSPLRQRYGIGEAMYDHANKVTGKAIENNPSDQLKPGKAFRKTVDLPPTPQAKQVQALAQDLAAERANANDDPSRRKLSNFLGSLGEKATNPPADLLNQFFADPDDESRR